MIALYAGFSNLCQPCEPLPSMFLLALCHIFTSLFQFCYKHDHYRIKVIYFIGICQPGSWIRQSHTDKFS